MKKALLLPALILLAACGSGSESGRTFVDGQGHPDGWSSHLTIGTENFHGTAIKEVLSDDRGAVLFMLHCAPCHSDDATGRIGPDIRGEQISQIEFAVTIPIMRGHAILTRDEIAAVADHLDALERGEPPVGASINSDSCSECHGRQFDDGIAGVSCFSCHDGPEGATGHPEGWLSALEDPIRFHGRYGLSFVEGCTTCHGVDLRGLIGPSCFSCHDGINAPPLVRIP